MSEINIPERHDYNVITPFRLFVKSNFPFIENTYESLDNYGLYCKVVEYLNQVIGEQNKVNADMVTFTDFVTNYFENLDVSEEINNKLDEMAETGVLQQLVLNIFKSLDDQIKALASGSPAGVYNTVQELTSDNPPHNRVYIVNTDGQWYYWNTSSNTWQAGGVYQASQDITEVNDLLKAVEPLESGYIKYENRYINNAGNIAIVDNSDLFCFKVTPNKKIIEISTTGNFFYYAFYTSKPVLGDVSISESRVYNQTRNKMDIDVPYNAEWIAISTAKDTIVTINPSSIIENILLNSKSIQDTLGVYENLYTGLNNTTGKLAYYENGIEYDNANYSITDYIPIDSDYYYELLTYSAHLCLYDANKNFMSGLLISSGTITEYRYNFGSAKYIRISMPTAGLSRLTIGALHTPSYKKEYFDGYKYEKITIPGTREISGETAQTTACLKLPPKYKPYGKPTKLCIIVHGASKGISESGNSWTLEAGYNSIVNALFGLDIAVMDINGYNDESLGYNHWGCPQAISAYIKAYEYFTKNYNLDKNVFVYGFSMGGLTALTLGIEKVIPIRAMMIACPVISLYDQCVVKNNDVVRDDFKNAYQINDYDTNAVKGYDRLGDIINIDNTDYNFKINTPLFIAYGLSDENVSNEYIQKYYQSLKNSNCNTIIQGFTGGHEISYGGSQAVLVAMNRFFNRF